MPTPSDAPAQADPFDLARFLDAQAGVYACALAELQSGRKCTHWMWFIFPQLAGLGHSGTAQYYGITGLAEARQYLAHPVLGARLRECAQALLALTGRSVDEILGYPDNLKLKSCMTLFAAVDEPGSVFARVLDKYCGGERDALTLGLLARGKRATPND